MAKSALVKANEQIAEGVVGAYQAVEAGVVGAYWAVEAAFVGGYRGIENAFVDQYLTRDGESVEDAKARLRAEQEARQEQDRHGAPAAPGADYAQRGCEQSMERTRRAQEMAQVPGAHAAANKECGGSEHEEE